MSCIKKNIQEIQDDINLICINNNRNPDEVKLIAVTKTIEPSKINEAIECGLLILGENKVQEITDKYDRITSDVEWHMIGHLQTNKVKYIIDKVKLIHSIDSIRLAKEINKRCKKINKTMDVLIQINISDEESKFGISEKDIYSFIEKLEILKNIKIKGLMTIVPYVENPEEVRPYFKKMKNIFDSLKDNSYDNIEMKYLSMGMTNDYKVAIEEGANMIRIGTGIFGKRNYKK